LPECLKALLSQFIHGTELDIQTISRFLLQSLVKGNFDNRALDLLGKAPEGPHSNFLGPESAGSPKTKDQQN
jgi:hypothetical protein